MRTSFASPVSRADKNSTAKQITAGVVSSKVKSKSSLSVILGSKSYTMIESIKTPHGVVMLTANTSDGDYQEVGDLMTGHEDQPLFVEIDTETYEVNGIEDDGDNLVANINPNPISFASRRKTLAMFVDSI